MTKDFPFCELIYILCFGGIIQETSEIWSKVTFMLVFYGEEDLESD